MKPHLPESLPLFKVLGGGQDHDKGVERAAGRVGKGGHPTHLVYTPEIRD